MLCTQRIGSCGRHDAMCTHRLEEEPCVNKRACGQSLCHPLISRTHLLPAGPEELEPDLPRDVVLIEPLAAERVAPDHPLLHAIHRPPAHWIHTNPSGSAAAGHRGASCFYSCSRLPALARRLAHVEGAAALIPAPPHEPHTSPPLSPPTTPHRPLTCSASTAGRSRRPVRCAPPRHLPRHRC